MTHFTINSKLCERDGICVEECPPGIIEIKKKGDFPSPVEKRLRRYASVAATAWRSVPTVHFLSKT